MGDIYNKLRSRLGDLATGYPATESKIEFRLLERLFTEEEAELFLQLSPLMQKPQDELYEPPRTGTETYIRIVQERGKI